MQQRVPAGRRRRERTFVVRLWREAGAEPGTIRCTVDDVAGGIQHAFADLAEMVEFLRQRLEVGIIEPQIQEVTQIAEAGKE